MIGEGNMGAESFWTRSYGKDVKGAFLSAVDNAQYMDGHGGYSGTIAEKSSYILIDVPKGKNPLDFANELMDNNDPRIDDKWGPAGAIDVTNMEKKRAKELGTKWKRGQKAYLFFGWASS